jgi:hypothetical protein
MTLTINRSPHACFLHMARHTLREELLNQVILRRLPFTGRQAENKISERVFLFLADMLRGSLKQVCQAPISFELIWSRKVQQFGCSNCIKFLSGWRANRSVHSGSGVVTFR